MTLVTMTLLMLIPFVDITSFKWRSICAVCFSYWILYILLEAMDLAIVRTLSVIAASNIWFNSFTIKHNWCTYWWSGYIYRMTGTWIYPINSQEYITSTKMLSVAGQVITGMLNTIFCFVTKYCASVQGKRQCIPDS